MIYNLNIIIYAMIIVPKILIDYLILEKYVWIQFQEIITLIIMIKSIKNVMIDAKLVINLEMQLFIIVFNVWMTIDF